MDPLMMAMLGMGMNGLSTLMGQQYGSAQAQANRDWQERMSDTSWQRGVADMEKAGLNPILAVSKGGASSPGGATGVGPSPDLGGSAVQGFTAAMQARQTQASVNQAEAQTAKIDAERLGQLATTARTWQDVRVHVPDEVRAKLDEAFYKTWTGQTARDFGNSAYEGGRGGAAGLMSGLAGVASKKVEDNVDWRGDPAKAFREWRPTNKRGSWKDVDDKSLFPPNWN